MDVFVKAVSIALIAVVLCLFVGKRDKEIAMLLSLIVCCFLTIFAVQYIKPVFAFFDRLQSLGDLDQDILSVLLQVVGIGLIAQIMGAVCVDAGYAAIARALHLLATAMILCSSLPVFSKLLELLEGILQKA